LFMGFHPLCLSVRPYSNPMEGMAGPYLVQFFFVNLRGG
jgi:hypothetical protein